MADLQRMHARIASSRLATTSQPRGPPAPRSYGGEYGRRAEGPRAVAIALQDERRQRAELEALQQEERWAAEQQAAAAAAAEAAARPPRPLKINRDLLLYRARRERAQAFQAPSPAARLECLRRSEAALRRCLALEPADARAYVSLGKLLAQQRRFDEARRVYEDAVAVTGGRNAFVWQAWATLEARGGKVAKARKYYNAAVLVSPGHAAAWHGWGLLEKREGNLVAARDLWVKGVRKTKDSPNSHLYTSLASLAGEMGFVDEARAWFRQGTATVRGAQSHALWHAWAQLEQARGELRVVRYLYRKGLEATPRSRYIHLAWAMFEKAQGFPERTRRLLQRGHELNRNDAAILQAWAVLEEERGEAGEARRLFAAAAAADPGMVHAWHGWGMLELRQGDLPAARERFQSAVWAGPSNADACKVWQAWAVLEFLAGNFALARSLCNCAVKADPGSAKAWDTWIYQEEQLGNEQRVALLRKAREAGALPPALPPRFAAPADVGGDADARSVLDSVAQTVSQWLRGFEAQRSLVRRQPPSYLLPPRELADGALERAEAPLPDMQAMMQAHEADLDLPEVASKFLPGRRGQPAQAGAGEGGAGEAA